MRSRLANVYERRPSTGDVVGCTHCELSADVGSGGSESGGDGTGGKHLGVTSSCGGYGSTISEWSEDGRTDSTDDTPLN